MISKNQTHYIKLIDIVKLLAINFNFKHRFIFLGRLTDRLSLP